jgi:hypothetical protein
MPRSPASGLGDDALSSTPDPENTMNRFAAFAAALAAAVLLSACVFAPPSHASNAYDADALAKNSERALVACGAGNVKEVSAKSFSCK